MADTPQFVDTAREIAKKDDSEVVKEDFPLRPSNREVAGRLRQAVKRAGGNQAVAERSGVPLGTLNNYLRGRYEMKLQPLMDLAETCGVSLEWLATGSDPKQLGETPAPEAAAPAKSNLFNVLNIDRMSDALEDAQKLFASRGGKPSMRDLARVMLLLYDEYTDMAAKEAAEESKKKNEEAR